MADRELRRMHRAELIEIIYALKQSEDQLKAQNAALTAQLQDRQLRLESAGSIAQAALELNNVFAAAQKRTQTEADCKAMVERAEQEVQQRWQAFDHKANELLDQYRSTDGLPSEET